MHVVADIFKPAAALHRLCMCFSFWTEFSEGCLYIGTQTVAVQADVTCQHTVNLFFFPAPQIARPDQWWLGMDQHPLPPL